MAGFKLDLVGRVCHKNRTLSAATRMPIDMSLVNKKNMELPIYLMLIVITILLVRIEINTRKK